MKIQTTSIYARIDRAVRRGYNTISLQGSSRSSKTYNTLIWLILYCLHHSGTRLSIVRATLPALKGSVFVDFKEILYKMGIFNEKNLNKSEMTYEFYNGSWVEFFSTDSEQKLRGRKRDVLFVNEANELGFLEYQQLKMRTTRLTILDYNPSFSDEHWLCSVNEDPRTFHFISTYKDNPFLEQSIIDEIESLQYKNTSLWQVYGLGQQAIVEGVIFKDWSQCEFIPNYVTRHYIGMDFGFTNDPTAIVDIAVHGDIFYIKEISYNTHMLTSDIIKTLKDYLRDEPQLKVISESADPRMIEEIHRASINIHPVKKFAGSIEAGIQKMLEYKIHVTKDSVNVIKELKNYTYQQDKNGKWLNVPIDTMNHAIDAARYVCMTELMGGKKDIDINRMANRMR